MTRLTHRGPDDEGAWSSSDGRVSLGHRRLAIIDLSAAGRQPMTDGTGQLQIVFNGEIYNYQDVRRDLEKEGHCFRTATDTEVILEAYHEWGIDCLTRLNGMFALALFDADTDRLILARDRAGEKPLFYRTDGRSIAFASELKALFSDPACSRVMDLEALDYYLAFGYVPGDLCLVHGIRKLPQGHALTFDLRSGAVTVQPYWSLPADRSVPPTSESDLVDEMDRLLADSVRLRLIADVPVGVMLSGGIDSSLVTAMAARVSSRPVKTFTISFSGIWSLRRVSVRPDRGRSFRDRACRVGARAGNGRPAPGACAPVRRADRGFVDGANAPRLTINPTRGDCRARGRRRRRALRRVPAP